MSGAPFKYIKRGHTMHGKVSKSLSKKVLSQKGSSVKHTSIAFSPYGSMLHKTPFLTQKFFDKLLENFSRIV